MPKAAIQILICTNERPPEHRKTSCGGQHGGLTLYRRFKDLVRAQGRRDSVLVTRTGCQRHCSRGAVVTVWPANLSYGGVAEDDAEEILDHALRGEPEEIARLRMPEGDWE